MKTLILTPNKTEMCGMYQLAKDLAKEFDGEIMTKGQDTLFNPDYYDVVITFLYPMHKYGKRAQRAGIKWICYDQKIPPATKTYFPNFFRRQYMKVFKYLNELSMDGNDEYWDVTEREQKPRWNKQSTEGVVMFNGYRNIFFSNLIYDLNKGVIDKSQFKFFLYTGRKTDYKNFDRL